MKAWMPRFAFWRRVRRSPETAPESGEDPRAEELRRKLEESRTVAEEQHEQAAEPETPVDEAPDAPADASVEERRAAVHDRARAAADEMRGRVRDAFVLVDVVQTFEHEDGERLLESFRARHGGFVAALERARADGLPVIYANDNFGVWDGDAPRLLRQALDGRGGELVEAIAPREGETFVVKPRYSAFDHTPLELILRELEIERLLLGGMSTEGCVAQSAIGARELGFKVTVLAQACATVDERVEQVACDYLEQVAGAFVERGGGS